MKKTAVLFFVVFSVVLFAQQPIHKTMPAYKPTVQPLPISVYNTMHDSCTAIDIVYISQSGSMSLDQPKSVRYFTSFLTTKPAVKKPNAPLDATIMWQISGRAYQLGNIYFVGDSSGYVTFERENKEYVNALTPDGAAFLKTRGGK